MTWEMLQKEFGVTDEDETVTRVWVPTHIAVPRFPDLVKVIDEDGEEMLGRFIDGQWWDEKGRTKLLGYIMEWELVFKRIKEDDYED